MVSIHVAIEPSEFFKVRITLNRESAYSTGIGTLSLRLSDHPSDMFWPLRNNKYLVDHPVNFE